MHTCLAKCLAPVATPVYKYPMDRLQEILAAKRREIAKMAHREEILRAGSLLRNDFRSFREAIDRAPGALGLIAEVKKASPSAGVIAPVGQRSRQRRQPTILERECAQRSLLKLM